MARRILNRRDLRAQAEAAERLETETNEDEEQDEEEEDEEGESEEAEAGEGDDDDEDSAPKAKKKKAKVKVAKPKAPAKPRKSRSTKKTARMRVLWGVFSNSNVCVQKFEYPRRAEADALAAKLTTDKKSTHFVNPIKEAMEEKKEE
jgi:hypothetical protein